MGGQAVIYLDTQDFSRFADCLNGRGTPEATDVLDKLLPEIDAGRVVCPISMAHLSELLQYQDGGRDLTIRKAEAIERLAGPYAFRDFNDMISAELIDFAVLKRCIRHPHPKHPDFPLDREGQWHPSVERTLDNIKSKMDRDLDVALKEQRGVPRALRRKVKSVMRTGGWEQALANPESMDQMRDFASSYPVTDRFLDLMPRFLLGKVRAEEVEAELFKGMRRPTNFVTWYFERYEGSRDLPNWMRSLGANIAQALIEFKDNIASIDLPSNVPTEFLTEQSEKFALSVSSRLFAEAAPGLKRLGVGQHAIDRLLADPGRIAAPVIRNLATLAMHTLKRHISNGRNAPKVKLSDGGDLMHALYLPHCDLWRGDASSAELVRQAFPEYKGRVVGKLRDLPSQLRAVQEELRCHCT